MNIKVMNNPISPLLYNNIPEFTKELYPRFQDFLRNYYEWMELDGQYLRELEDFGHNNVLSNNVERYIDKFLTDSGFIVTDRIEIKKYHFALFLREFYLSKGSVQSYRYLFRALYNDEITIQYPRDWMFIPSQSELQKTYSIFLTSTMSNSQEFEYIYSNVDSLGAKLESLSTNQTTAVDSIRKINSGGKLYLKLDIIKPRFDFQPFETIRITIDNTSIIEQVYNVLDLQITKSGYGYKPTDTVNITGCNVVGSNKIDLLSRGDVKGIDVTRSFGFSVNDNVRVKVIDPVIDEGFGFNCIVDTVNGKGSILTYRIVSNGSRYSKLPINEKGVKCLSDSIGGIQLIKYHTPYIDFDRDSVNVEIVTNTGTGFEYRIAEKTIYETTERKSWEGVIGVGSTITDSFKYQNFSYEIISNTKPEHYEPYVKELLHPVGYVRFPVLVIRSSDTIGFDPRNINSMQEKVKNFISSMTFTTDLVTNSISTMMTFSKFNKMVFNRFINIEKVKVQESYKAEVINDFGTQSIEKIYSKPYEKKPLPIVSSAIIEVV